MFVTDSQARSVLVARGLGREMPALPEHALKLARRSDILALRVRPERIAEAIWMVDAFTELCDRYRGEHAVPFRAETDPDGRIGAPDAEAAARYVGVWSHARHGAEIGLDAALLDALDERPAAIVQAGKPGSERWDALVARAGVFGARVTDHAKTLQFVYRLQIGVIRIFCRSAALSEWLESVSGALDGDAREISRACPCGCDTR